MDPIEKDGLWSCFYCLLPTKTEHTAMQIYNMLAHSHNPEKALANPIIFKMFTTKVSDNQ